MADETSTEKQVEALKEQITILEAVNKALMGRVERSIDSAANSYALFESNIVLQKAVNQRTNELQVVNDQLRQEVTVRRQAEEQIMASLREKEVLLKEVHHRVKNNLQIIASLLNLQAAEITDRKTQEMFRDSMGRVKSMAIIHERLYQSENLAEVEFADYVDGLTKSLMGSVSGARGRIRVVSDIDPITFPVDVAVPSGLIVNELVTNALKHAFPDNRSGEIRISCKQVSSGHISLTVSDDGVGVSDEIAYANTESLGMRLVHALTEQLGGKLTLSSERGTRCAIEFECSLQADPTRIPAPA